MILRHKKLLGAALLIACLALALGLGLSGAPAQAASQWEAVEQPALVITGAAIVGKPASAAEADLNAVIDSLSNEKAYTMAELKALPQAERLYSTNNSGGFRKQYLSSGVDIYALIKLSNYDLAANKTADVIFKSGASFRKLVEDYAAHTRYRYPAQAAGSEAGKTPVEGMITLKSAISADNSDTPPEKSALAEQAKPSLTLGALDFADMNQSGFVKDLDTIQVGDALTANSISLFGTTVSRADLLLKERATATYTYITKAGTFTDTVRGIALKSLVTHLKDTDAVTISFTDGYKPLEISVADIRKDENRYLLALEKKTADGWQAVYHIKNGYSGIGAIYFGAKGATAGGGPSAMIAAIAASGDDYANSPFKHIAYAGTESGAIYAPDVITGATLTVEGPGVTATTPIMVGDMERADSGNLYRGAYTDYSGGKATTLLYEGATVKSVIEGGINSLISRVGDDIRIVFKNRWRQDVASIPYSDLLAAKQPVILAYGVGSLDGSSVAPFVYDKEPGIIPALGNDDGCLKLVFDAADFPSLTLPREFSSVAYLYVEFAGDAPGYKHSGAADEAYSNTSNTEYIVTLLGSALGREVNFTVAELEAMVAYDSAGAPAKNGLGHRAAYSLSNTTYWYVNSYEGVKLWDLLLKLGLDAKQYQDDEQTLITFSAWDNYRTTASFSMRQLADPNQFYFYEKSPVDIGTDRPGIEDLAKKENQPDNQLGVWVKDANGYPVQKGYPVLLAYGVNGYPYVRNANMEGFYGGLGNDGGPVRVIFGKADGLNRANPEDITNYAYFFNNGSNQMQRAQEIFIGEEIRYSTHYQNPDAAYQAMLKDIALSVDIVQANGNKETKAFTLKQLEEIIYNAEKRDRDNSNRQEKAYYQYQGGKDALFEGVNLWYLLSEAIGMQGSIGTATLYSGDTAKAQIALDELKLAGYNSLRDVSGLEAMVAFAKGGYPLVKDSMSAGYVKSDAAAKIAVDNAGGPLAFVRPQNESEYAAGSLSANSYVPNLTRIVVNLEADRYAHTEAYASYGAGTVAISGAVSRSGAMSIADIEKLQKYMITDTYTIDGETQRYRGVDLQKLLADVSVSASALMSEVTLSNVTGKSVTIPVAELAAGVNGKRILLAYGVGKPEGEIKDGRPLVPTVASSGYDAAYGNDRGPLRLIMEGGAAADCIGGVNAIKVSAAEVQGWNHTSGYYADYLDLPILRITGDGVAQPVTFTVGQLESLTNEMVLDSYKLTNEIWVQGVDLYKLLMNYVELKDPGAAPNFTVLAKDAYSTAFKGSDLANGVNGKPMLIAYGQGNSRIDGLPLVDGNDQTEIMDGFDPEYGNAFGPIRLMVHDNSGWCVKWMRCIIIGSGSYEDPADYADELADIEVTVGKPGSGSGAAQGGYYTVQPGDTLAIIAAKALGDHRAWQSIYDANRHQIGNPHLIFPGQVLILPR